MEAIASTRRLAVRMRTVVIIPSVCSKMPVRASPMGSPPKTTRRKTLLTRPTELVGDEGKAVAELDDAIDGYDCRDDADDGGKPEGVGHDKVEWEKEAGKPCCTDSQAGKAESILQTTTGKSADHTTNAAYS